MFQQIDHDVVKQNKHKVLVSSKVPGQGQAEGGSQALTRVPRKSVPGKGQAGGTKAADVKRHKYISNTLEDLSWTSCPSGPWDFRLATGNASGRQILYL